MKAKASVKDIPYSTSTGMVMKPKKMFYQFITHNYNRFDYEFMIAYCGGLNINQSSPFVSTRNYCLASGKLITIYLFIVLEGIFQPI